MSEAVVPAGSTESSKMLFICSVAAVREILLLHSELYF